MKIHFPHAIFFTFVLVLMCPASSGFAQDTVSISNESLRAVERLQSELETLESRYDPYHQSLLEPLQAMEVELIAQGRYDEVARLQSRRLQILRTQIGLESLGLVPVLEDTIDNQIRLANWDEVSDLLEHVHHLQVTNFGNESEAALDALDRQATWYLARVALDPRERRARNFVDARDLYDDMLDLAEDRYDEDDPRLVPWLYRRAFSLYQLVQFMNTDDGLAGETIDEVIRRDGMARLTTFRRPGVLDSVSVFGPASRVPVVEEGELIGIGYLRQALGFIDDIVEIAEARDDRHMLAMATLYHGDFQRLMDRGFANRDYRDTITMLVELGIEQARIDEFFAHPMVIPHEVFFTSFADIESYQQQILALAPEMEEGLHLGTFTAWHESLPATPRPDRINSFLASEEAVSEVLLTFRINSRGQVSSIDVVSAEPDAQRVERQARQALEEVRFRPLFRDGRPRTLRQAYMLYQSTQE